MDANETLRESVREAYSEAALQPTHKHPFPVGREFAENVGFPAEVLDSMAAVSIAAYAGVSAVSIQADLRQGAIVLDVGCGAGLDSLIAASRVGPHGRVIGIDFSASMLERARMGARERGAANAFFTRAAAENLPVRSSSIDSVLVNGIFNLNPFRQAIFAELGRVTRTGGSVYAAELVLREPVTEEMRSGSANWFS